MTAFTVMQPRHLMACQHAKAFCHSLIYSNLQKKTQFPCHRFQPLTSTTSSTMETFSRIDTDFAYNMDHHVRPCSGIRLTVTYILQFFSLPTISMTNLHCIGDFVKSCPYARTSSLLNDCNIGTMLLFLPERLLNSAQSLDYKLSSVTTSLSPRTDEKFCWCRITYRRIAVEPAIAFEYDGREAHFACSNEVRW